jgi:hypothetical protein
MWYERDVSQQRDQKNRKADDFLLEESKAASSRRWPLVYALKDE